MKRQLFLCLMMMCSLAIWSPSWAQEKAEAIKASDEIMALLASQQYKAVWDQKVSKWFKDKTTEHAFLANMTMSRQGLGPLSSSSFVTSDFADRDPQSGTVARIYANTYLNQYQAGKFYERIVVMKEADGRFRLSGIWGGPAQ